MQSQMRIHQRIHRHREPRYGLNRETGVAIENIADIG